MSTTHFLREILLEGKARTQSEILKEFEKQNIKISQPKVSRLLHQIGAVKVVDSKGKTHYRLPHEAGLLHELTNTQEKKLLREWIFTITANESLIVIHTAPGAAGMVARVLDQHRQDLDILGTLAGDDTIFIAPKPAPTTLRDVVEKISALFEL